jgi:hypothetical protein
MVPEARTEIRPNLWKLFQLVEVVEVLLIQRVSSGDRVVEVVGLILDQLLLVLEQPDKVIQVQLDLVPLVVQVVVQVELPKPCRQQAVDQESCIR